MNTDTMYGNKPLYAYVYIGIRRKVAFPLYLRNQRQQGYLHDKFRMECYSEAEVSWYLQLCARMSRWLVLLHIDYVELINDGYTDSIDGGGNLEATPDAFPVRERVDGKFFGETVIRETYDGNQIPKHPDRYLKTQDLIFIAARDGRLLAVPLNINKEF